MELKLLWLISRTLSSDNSKIEVEKLPPNAFLLKFKWFSEDKCRISGGIWPERLRKERSREVIWALFWAHLIPDQEHQTGDCSSLETEEFDKYEVGSQFCRVFCGSFRDDFRDRRERSWRGISVVSVVVSAWRANGQLVVRKKKQRRREKTGDEGRRRGKGRRFMAFLGIWRILVRRKWC